MTISAARKKSDLGPLTLAGFAKLPDVWLAMGLHLGMNVEDWPPDNISQEGNLFLQGKRPEEIDILHKRVKQLSLLTAESFLDQVHAQKVLNSLDNDEAGAIIETAFGFSMDQFVT